LCDHHQLAGTNCVRSATLNVSSTNDQERPLFESLAEHGKPAARGVNEKCHDRIVRQIGDKLE
jgi:hypothetical protein